MNQSKYNTTNLFHPIELDQRQEYLLKQSKTFCIYPWVHLNLDPNGDAKPCCTAEWRDIEPLGNASQQSMREIWNSPGMKELRVNMLNDTPNKRCSRCYEKESTGFLSPRNSANIHHGHHIGRVNGTDSDGYLDQFQMVYWDVRFSNLCNLRCRTCGPGYSSQWYQDQIKLYPEYQKNHKPLIFAGRHETDIWEQLVEHIDHVEHIYFAGGEPLIMDEHYCILEELVRREMFHVRLVYNTNFTQVHLKDRRVFDYWNKFSNVSVGASLDAMGPLGEYMRKGCRWAEVEDNRRHMQDLCPHVDFYISPTLSIMNAWHLPDFHRNWVERGLIQARDLNVNILQDPPHLRLDIAPIGYKQEIKLKYEKHIEWLRSRDHFQRATRGFESAVNFMMSSDNTGRISECWENISKIDHIRGENILDVAPELKILQ